MEYNVNQYDTENSVKLEAEDQSSRSEKYNLENIEDLNQEVNNSRRRSKRTRIKNHRYKFDEDRNNTLSPDNFECNDKNSDEDLLLQEQLSSTSSKNISAIKNMNKRKSVPFVDTLGQVLIEIGLYDELYEFMKSRGITAEALKYMKTRHIDELFRGTRLSTKIVFEHNLREWQNKNGIFEVSTAQINNGNSSFHGVQLMPQMEMPLSQRLNETDILSLSHRLTNSIQEAVNKVLQEFKVPCQQSQQFNNCNMQFNDEIPIDEDTLRNIKIEPNSFPEEINTIDKSLRKVNKNSNKLNNTVDEFLLSKQSFKSITSLPKRRKMDIDISVNEILSTFQFGQHLINEYKKTGVFTPSQRTELIRIIVEFYVRNNGVMNAARCKEIAKEIVELFPTESMDVYFMQENKSRPPKGKIWDRYQVQKRLKRKMNDSKICKESIKVETPHDINDSETRIDWSDMEAMCAEMKHINDEKLLLEKWKESFAFRRHQLQSGWFSNWKLYFDEYPFCKQQNYAKYIESDLYTMYPNLKFYDYLWDEFMKHFSTFFLNRIKHPKSKQLFDKLVAEDNFDMTSDYIAIKVIELLHAVLKTYGKQLQSIEEAQRKFTVEVSDLSDLKKVVIERKKQCTDNNIQAKPYIAVVGQNKSYSHFSVILDSTGFSCDNYKDSLILCFNLYLFFDLSFPRESLNVWTFIQKYFFNKPTLVNNPRVESFINDVKAQKLIIYDDNINGTK